MEPGHPALAHQLPMDQARAVHLRAQSASPVWSEGFHAPTPMDAAFSAEDFAKFQQQQQQHHMLHQQPQQPMASSAATAAGPSHAAPVMGMNAMNMGMGMGMNAMPYMMYRQNMQANWAQPQFQQPPPGQRAAEGKGKGKVVELDDHQWEEQFARMDMHDKTAADEEVQKGQKGQKGKEAEAREDAEAEAAMERELNQMDEKLLQPETDFGDLEAVWKGIQTEDAAMRSAFGGDDWKDVSDTYNNWGSEWEPVNYRMGMDPRIEPYQFEQDNLFREQQNPFEEGVRIMSENGNLSLAALAFEAACAREPGRVEAWVYLGSAQAQNEKETAAIRALEQALKLDPANQPALMALAVSYTNEGYDTTAYRTLERWLSSKYPQVLAATELSSAADVGFTDRQQLHDGITERFIQAAQLSPDGEHMDPDVQVGLGVLFYGAEDFGKAVDCFHAALASSEQGTSNQRSQIHLLWNRLGATLANSGRSEEAIAAYEKALSQHPNFVRARYNLGVSCINMGCYEEAASHLLAALAMHKAVEQSGREQAREILGGVAAGVTDEHLARMTTQNRSTTLYDTLRRVFGLMDRRDLADRVAVDMNPDSFRNEFDF